MNCAINQKGYVVLVITFFILIIILSVALTMSSLVALGQKTATNAVKSTQSYYAAESGVEDALLILRDYPQISSASYVLNVNGVATSVVIPTVIGGARTITSQGNNNNIIRKIQTVYSVDSEAVNFYYGIEVGEGGLVMNNGSEVNGNVFSNGNISGSGTIENNAIVSGNGHSIQGVRIEGNAIAYSCNNATIDGNLTYVTGGSNSCAVHGTTSTQSQEIAQQPLPIPQSQIDAWKSEATAVRVITGNVTLSNNQTRILGPVKITGSLTLGNRSTLILTGTIYVQGNINLNNNDVVKLDSSYGSLGGIIIADGIINTGTGNIFSGSGQTGSYLLFISTSASDSAITVSNNSAGAVFYTTVGGIQLPNNVSVLEAAGYKLILGNNAEIQSSSGIVNIFFSSGPAAGWKVTSWSEQ